MITQRTTASSDGTGASLGLHYSRCCLEGTSLSQSLDWREKSISASSMEGSLLDETYSLRYVTLDSNQRKLLNKLLEWFNTPDDMGPDWWDEFRLHLAENPLRIGQDDFKLST